MMYSGGASSGLCTDTGLGLHTLQHKDSLVTFLLTVVHESVQGQVGWGFEERGLMEAVPGLGDL